MLEFLLFNIVLYFIKINVISTLTINKIYLAKEMFYQSQPRKRQLTNIKIRDCIIYTLFNFKSQQ